MSIFKEHKTSADRSAKDRGRHKEKIKKAIREGITDIISDESIIGQDGKKKIKIPVRGIKEYRFIYGDNENNKKTGAAPGKNIRKGQKLGQSKKGKGKGKSPGQPGTEAGEEFYEVEITLEELSYYLFDSLNLPDLEKKRFKEMSSEKFKRKGYRPEGIRPRLDKKETLKNKIRRQKIKARTEVEAGSNPENENEETFPFHNKDLKYKHITKKKVENTAAVIFFIMDTSGSMSQNKKFIARSFFFLLYHFLRHKYENIEIVFIAHDVEAKEVTEDDFFKKGSSGGTLMSSGLTKCVDIIDKRYHPDAWNIYTFHCSDGDNWIEDNEKAITLSLKLKDVSQLYSYIQILPGNEVPFWSNGGMANVYLPIVGDNFKIVHLENSNDIWPEFKRIFGGKINV